LRDMASPKNLLFLTWGNAVVTMEHYFETDDFVRAWRGSLESL